MPATPWARDAALYRIEKLLPCSDPRWDDQAPAGMKWARLLSSPAFRTEAAARAELDRLLQGDQAAPAEHYRIAAHPVTARQRELAIIEGEAG